MISIYSPSELWNKIIKSVTPEIKTSFYSTFLIGFFCHLFIITNSMYNNDDIRYLYVTFDKPELGRWLQTYAAGISSYFSLPVVNSILGLLYLSCASVVITCMFDLKDKFIITLISGILVTFPSVACILSYMFAADPFFLACLLSCLAAYCVTLFHRKYSWIAGALFLCASVSIYQAYLPFTLLLMLLYFILALLMPNKYTNSDILALGIRYILMLVSGMTFYYAGMILTLKFKHTTLSDYQGISESSFPTFSDIKNRIITLFYDFLSFFGKKQVLAFNTWMQIALFFALLILALIIAVFYFKNKIYKSPMRNALFIFCVACIPISVNVIYLISDGVTFHMLMRHAWCLLFVAVAILTEKSVYSLSPAKYKLLQWSTVLTLLLIIWNYILLSNIAYFNMNFRYEKTYALCMKIMDRIEQSEDYDSHRPIAFIGNYSKTYEMDSLIQLLEPMSGMKGKRVFSGASRAYQPFIQNCIGIDIEIATPEEEKEIISTPEFQEMPRFPKKGSIQVIHDITVVKLNDN